MVKELIKTIRTEEASLRMNERDGISTWTKDWVLPHVKRAYRIPKENTQNLIIEVASKVKEKVLGKAGVAQKKERVDLTYSPWWGKAVFYKHKAVSALFPDSSIQVKKAYIKETGKGAQEIDQIEGRNILIRDHAVLTESFDVGGDTAMRATRDEIIRTAYKTLMQVNDRWKNKPDSYSRADTEKLDAAVKKADDEMVREFGNFLNFPPVDEVNNAHTEEDFLKFFYDHFDANPSPMTDELRKMLEAGILPTHPQFNFIPTHRQDNHVMGKFIEFEIVYPSFYRKYVHKNLNEADMKTALSYLDRMILYDYLDRMYEDIAYDIPRNTDPNIRRNLLKKFFNTCDSETRKNNFKLDDHFKLKVHSERIIIFESLGLPPFPTRN